VINKAEFEKILEMEREALSLYSTLFDQLPDSPIKEKVREIRDDEAKHVRIAKKMLSIVEGAFAA
jgi:rubrerythrin